MQAGTYKSGSTNRRRKRDRSKKKTKRKKMNYWLTKAESCLCCCCCWLCCSRQESRACSCCTYWEKKNKNKAQRERREGQRANKKQQTREKEQERGIISIIIQKALSLRLFSFFWKETWGRGWRMQDDDDVWESPWELFQRGQACCWGKRIDFEGRTCWIEETEWTENDGNSTTNNAKEKEKRLRVKKWGKWYRKQEATTARERQRLVSAAY